MESIGIVSIVNGITNMIEKLNSFLVGTDKHTVIPECLQPLKPSLLKSYFFWSLDNGWMGENTPQAI